MSFLKLLLAFAPWIAFLIIAHGSLFRLKLGLVIAFALCVVMGVTRLHRGVILWAGLCFFTFATIAVVMFENMWTVQHMGVLASGTLAVSAGASLAIGKPFTLDYAREHTDSILWNQPEFLRTNFIITCAYSRSQVRSCATLLELITNRGRRSRRSGVSSARRKSELRRLPRRPD